MAFSQADLKGERFQSNDAEDDETRFVGTLTSSSFAYQEIGGVGRANNVGTVEPENSSSVSRLFSDLRLRLDAEHIKGSGWNFRLDFRGRFHPSRCQTRRDGRGNALACTASQSGSFGGNELDAREVYLERQGENYDFKLGRQFIPETAYLKMDGLRITKNSGEMTYSAFAGLFPNRMSRNIRFDYPVIPEPEPGDATQILERRILPLFGGVGATYQKGRFQGSLGGAAILPMARVLETTRVETPRVLLSAAGYLRMSNKTDLYHSAVVDLAGQAGAGLTNLVLGVSHKLFQDFKLDAQATRVDTETLSVQIQNRLETPDPNQLGVQSNVFVRRSAAESGRVSASLAAFERRFELTLAGTLRRRPAISFVSNLNEVEFQAAQTGEAFFQLVDRRLLKKYRLSLSIARTFSVGDSNLDRSTATIGRLNLRRGIKDGKGELDIDLSYIASVDDGLGLECAQPFLTDFANCYGRSEASTTQLGGILYYTLRDNIYAVVQGNLGYQTLNTTTVVETLSQGGVFMLSGFLRLGYRL